MGNSGVCFGELTPLSCRADGGQTRVRDEVQEIRGLAGQNVRHWTEVTPHLRGNGFRTAMRTIAFAVVLQPLMARQLSTVCFPAESFLRFPFSLQLLPFSAWFSQNGSDSKQGRGKAGWSQSLSAPFCFLLKLGLVGAEPELAAKRKDFLFLTETAYESQNIYVRRWGLFQN